MRDVRRFGGVARVQHHTVAAALARDRRSTVDRHRHDQAARVVGVVADQVHAARRAGELITPTLIATPRPRPLGGTGLKYTPAAELAGGDEREHPGRRATATRGARAAAGRATRRRRTVAGGTTACRAPACRQAVEPAERRRPARAARSSRDCGVERGQVGRGHVAARRRRSIGQVDARGTHARHAADD